MLKHELEQHLGIKVTDEFYTYINARYMEGDYKDQKDFRERFLGSCEPLIKIESPTTEELETENQQELTHNTIETVCQKRKRKDVPPPVMNCKTCKETILRYLNQIKQNILENG